MNPVEQLKNEYESIAGYLKDNEQVSLLSDLNKNFKKVLLLSAGSYFEHKVTSILSEFVRAKSKDERIINFLEKQAISGKYHQLFSWGSKDKPDEPGKSANTFFKLFGEDFKKSIDAELKISNTEDAATREEREKITSSIEAFIEVGHLRNILVHSNFADYNYDQKTTDEIFQLFQKAEPFIEYLQKKLN